MTMKTATEMAEIIAALDTSTSFTAYTQLNSTPVVFSGSDSHSRETCVSRAQPRRGAETGHKLPIVYGHALAVEVA
jgi:hypothetical protein